MVTINIKTSTVMLTKKRATEIMCSILAETDSESKFMPSKIANQIANLQHAEWEVIIPGITNRTALASIVASLLNAASKKSIHII